MTENVEDLVPLQPRVATRDIRSLAIPVADLDDKTDTDWVPVDSLQPGDSPRLAGENLEHTQALIESAEMLPPILVHRSTMRVIDGLHRVRAAVLKGQELIEVRFFDGSIENAFVLAVRANIAHGLPLSLADRRAAAARIVSTHPDWSDRAIASVVGLAAGTVAAVRSRSDGTDNSPALRVGLDGRLRALDAAAGRRIASQVIASRPDASLREIARAAGISAATARDVRERLRRAEDPVTLRRIAFAHNRRDNPSRATPRRHGGETLVAKSSLRDLESLVDSLRKDPSLRLTESGRTFLRWLLPRVNGAKGWRSLIGQLPPHCAYLVIDLARSCAEDWSEFARRLEARMTE